MHLARHISHGLDKFIYLSLPWAHFVIKEQNFTCKQNFLF